MKIIAIDIDRTIVAFDKFRGLDHFGEPFPGAVEFTKQLGELGHVLVYSCRTNPAMAAERELLPEGLDHRGAQVWLVEKVKKGLDAHGFYYDEVYAGPGKPDADIYIDDKGLDCRPGVFNAPDAQIRYFDMIVKQASYRIA